MNKILTYEDLVRREQQIELLLKLQKEQVQNDLRGVMDAGKTAVIGSSENFLLNKGVNTVIDVVVKKGLLAKASWLYRLAVPFILKRYSSSYISDHKKDIKEKFFSFFRSKSNGVNKTKQ